MVLPIPSTVNSLVPGTAQHRRVVGCGFVAWDVVFAKDTRQVAYTGVGGTVGNVLSIMAFLGWRSQPLVRLGADTAGLRVLEELTALGVDTSGVSLHRNLRTPVVYQFNGDRPGQHVFSFSCPHCGQSRRFSPELLTGIGCAETWAPIRGDVFFFDRLTLDVVRLAEEARSNGALTVFEPSLLGHDGALLTRALRCAHVVKYSSDRIVPAALAELGAGFVEIQTLGADGLRFRMRSLDPSWVRLPAVRIGGVVDTAGAGDWCTAGFLHVLGSMGDAGMPCDLGYNRIHSALKCGQMIAALNCATLGARGLMRRDNAAQFREMLLGFESLEHLRSEWDDAVQAASSALSSRIAAMLAPSASALRRLPATDTARLCSCAFAGPGAAATLDGDGSPHILH